MATRLESVHRFTVDEYYRMAELGILPSGPMELIEGRVLIGGRPWRFSTEDYYRLVEAGILTEDDRVELIEGEILDMAAIGSRHAGCVNRLVTLLVPKVSGVAVLSVQNPLRVGEGVEPEADVMLLQPRADFYAEAHPTPADVLLLIEVADTSLGYDRGEKADIYAAAGIVEYWLADLTRQRVLVHTGPMPSGYARIETKDYTDSWSSASLPQLTVSGKDIFGE